MANTINTKALARAYKVIRQNGDGDKKVTFNAKRGTIIRIINEARKQGNEALFERNSTVASN